MSRYPGGIITKNPITPAGPNPTGAAPGVWRLNDVAYWRKQGLWPDASADRYWPYTSLLLSTTALGNANNNLFVDSSGAFNPISRNGNTTQGSFSPYGTNWSNYFDGSTAYLSVNAQTALSYGTGDFTMEAWVYPTSINSGFAPVIEARASASATTYAFGLRVSAGVYKAELYAGTQYTGTTTVSLNTWTHIAVSRSSGTLRLFVNGVLDTSWSSITTSINANAASQLIGVLRDGAGYYFPGYISNFRAVKGTAVYTSNFTVPTSPLTAISGTSLLTCQSNRFRDASSNNFAITAAGNTSVTEFGPFNPAYPGLVYNQNDIQYWSGYFDGSGDYLTAPNDAAFDYGSGNFCIEAWVYITSNSPSEQFIYGKRANTSSFAPFLAGFVKSGTAYRIYYLGSLNGSSWGINSSFVGGTIDIPLNTWTHVAYVRNGTTFTGYVNGVADLTFTGISGALMTNTTAVSVGAGGIDGNTPVYGNVSNIRVVKGSAVYTGAFTPPTAPLTAISGTSLLTCQNAAFTDNSTNNFVITQNGNTTVTGNNPFQAGYYSNYFDGSADSISAPSNAAFAFGTGAYTVEFWVNFSTLGGQELIKTSSAFTSGCWTIYYAGGQVQVVSVGGAGAMTYNWTTATTGQWYHMAICRDGSSNQALFINGTRVANGTYTNNFSQDGFVVGTGNSAYFNGYMSNLRVVKGTAVYDPTQSTLTVPTVPLTAISGTSLLTCQSARFIDTSSNAFTLTANGNTAIQAYNPFYTSSIASNGGSMYFDGGGDYLTVPTNASLQFGTGNFTVEFWMNLAARDSSGTCVFGNYNSFTTGAFGFFAGHASASTTLYQVAVNGTFPAIQSTATVVYNSWSHFAIVRNGNTMTLYINGVANGTFSMSGITVNGVGSNWFIGAAGDALTNYELNGWLSGFRVTKGTAVYTTNFTPPTAPVTPTAATTLLVNGMNAGAYDATGINDIETVGDAKVSTVQSKFGGSSMYFDGSGDALAARPNPVFAFGTSSFTIEAWVNVTSYAGTCAIFDTRTAGNEATGVIFYINASGQLSIYNNGTLATSSGSISTGTWTHVAVTRNGTTVTFWINGSSSGTATVSTNFTQQNGYVGTAYNASSNPFYGYMDDLRITKGVARYTSNFTPPTAAFPTY